MTVNGRMTVDSNPLYAARASDGSLSMTITLSGAQLDALADLVAPRLSPAPAFDGWLDSEQAAVYLATSRSRIHDLVQRRAVRFEREGRRLLFRREWLDEALSRP